MSFSFIFLLILVFAGRAMAVSVLPLTLNDLYSNARFIFYGKCISVQETVDSATGFPSTYTTFNVIQVIKGNVATVTTIKQFGGSNPDTGESVSIPDNPHFKVGKEYVVFLPTPSKLGYSSPVGLSQGVFNILLDKSGKKSVSGQRSFDELLNVGPTVSADTTVPGNNTQTQQPKTLSPAGSNKSSRMPLEDFLTIIKSMEKPQ